MEGAKYRPIFDENLSEVETIDSRGVEYKCKQHFSVLDLLKILKGMNTKHYLFC